MNKLEAIKLRIEQAMGDCHVFIYDESNNHEGHFEHDLLSSPSHLYIRVISDSFKGMSLISRHRKINDLMKNLFDQGLHALKIVAKTKCEVENESFR
jgi:stress-induced morphogen